MKPENLLVGDNGFGKLIIIDFGLSKRYVDQKGNHIKRVDNRPFRGTLRYCSINMHMGVENSRRDDLESLGYVLIYLMKGRLPWQSLRSDRMLKEEKIKKVKIGTSIDTLCQGLPPQFGEYMRAIRNLGFSETPDYQSYKQLFLSIFGNDTR